MSGDASSSAPPHARGRENEYPLFAGIALAKPGSKRMLGAYAAELYRAGLPLREVARRTGLSYRLVRQELTARGVPLRARGEQMKGKRPANVVASDSEPARLSRILMREQGLGPAEIARRVGIPEHRVRHYTRFINRSLKPMRKP